MAISVYLGNVNKRKNSTFVPSLTTGPVQVVLKDGTSDTNPSFLLSSSNAITANYLRWGSRYYFIEDVIYERNNLYTLKCALDVLATYKSDILNTSAFVAYDTSVNTELTDNRLSIETTKSLYANSQKFNVIGSGAVILVNVVGENSNACFAMYEASAKQLLADTTFNAWINSNSGLPYPDMTSLTDIADVLKVGVENLISSIRQLIATGKAADCIKSAFLLPIDLTHLLTTPQIIKLGKYDTAVLGRPIAVDTTITDDITITIPWATGINDWRRNAPYTRIYLYLPYVGCVEIPTSEIMGDATLTILTTISPSSGDTIFTVASDTRKILQFNTNIASPYGIGNSNVTAAQATSGLLSGVAGAIGTVATGGMAAVASGAMGINGITNNMAGMPSSIGTNVGSAALGVSQTASLFTVFHNTNVSPNSVSAAIGTPTMAVKTLSSCSGYVECRGASVSAAAESRILDEINSFLNGGFFIE